MFRLVQHSTDALKFGFPAEKLRELQRQGRAAGSGQRRNRRNSKGLIYNWQKAGQQGKRKVLPEGQKRGARNRRV